MHRSRSLLQKAAKSIAAEASTASKDAAKAAAVSAPHHDDSPLPPTPSPPAAPYILLHHHKHASLFQYRNPGTFPYFVHHMSSAFDALISLFATQESRDRFLLLTGLPSKGKDTTGSDDNGDEHGGKIINTSVLGFSDMGFVKSLALYQELNSPLYEQHPKLNINEFMEGCGWSLQQFHMTKDELFPKLMSFLEEDPKELNSADKGSTDSETENKPKMTLKSSDEFILGKMTLKSSYDFLDGAAKNPDSLENDFIDMTTPEMLHVFYHEGIVELHCRMVGSGKAVGIVPSSDKLRKYNTFMPIKDDTKVMNVALLSARVQEIYPPAPSDQTQKSDDDPDAPLEDDSLMPHREDSESNAQVVTQLEVLYELQQSSMNDDGKTESRTSMMVGKFETCLDGDPNGDSNGDGVRWRLASYRRAWEFM
eukprot:CAMPEP_0172325394 /NCGR_PEP_ID=MMETSP1058-20130122/53934_1 /TAXON_ID=83371 /ORGANISM="Detonula confervacea, Strain CCMP 353" /LENGTH=422 /DNA_ID=CAMNT_0013041931 /DNA_START=58 /DNA_END=1326 /DNA_ORIENTATION=-